MKREMMNLKFLAVGILLVSVCSAAMAFEEKPMNAGPGGSAPLAGRSAPTAGAGQGLGITTPDIDSSRAAPGTKIKIPGLGVIGEIPKMDFGLELLYGANQPKDRLDVDRDAEARGVMGRLRVPLKSP